MERNNVSDFFYYMWNAWSKEECKIVFEGEGWMHFWNKWDGICDSYGISGAAERFFAELSYPNQDRLVKRASELYNRKQRIA